MYPIFIVNDANQKPMASVLNSCPPPPPPLVVLIILEEIELSKEEFDSKETSHIILELLKYVLAKYGLVF